MWQTIGMKPPGPILVSKRPAAWKCVACSETFILTSSKEEFEGKMSQLEADYDKHFKECHSEDSN
jgi:hypothetical protein